VALGRVGESRRPRIIVPVVLNRKPCPQRRGLGYSGSGSGSERRSSEWSSRRLGAAVSGTVGGCCHWGVPRRSPTEIEVNTSTRGEFCVVCNKNDRVPVGEVCVCVCVRVCARVCVCVFCVRARAHRRGDML
jgi:hypothetical protein